MNITDLVTLLRNEVEKVDYKCYSPDLPQNDEICSSISIGDGEIQRALTKGILYAEIPVYFLIRGNANDKNTREVADDIFNQLDQKENISLNNTRIISIFCNTPNYAFRDENQRIYYNINCKVKVQWKE